MLLKNRVNISAHVTISSSFLNMKMNIIKLTKKSSLLYFNNENEGLLCIRNHLKI